MNVTEGKAALKERFVELRAAGLSYAACAEQLNVSKPTLLGWGKELAHEVGNARALRMDELFERFYVAKAKRIAAFGRRLDAILAELDTRDLSEVPTTALLALALKYGDALKDEAETLTVQGKETLILEPLLERERWEL